MSSFDLGSSVPTPTEELHAANKYYVDNQIGSLPSVETSNFLEKDAVNDVTTAFRVRSGGNTLISASGNELGLYNVVDPTNAAHALNLGYGDGRYLKKTGGTMTGDLAMDGADRGITVGNGNRLRVKATDANNTGRTFIDIQTQDASGAEGQDAGYRLRLYHLADPSSGYHAANKRYVDQQIAAIPDTDLSGLATEDYVDTQIDLKMVGIGVNRPPGLRFNYGNATTAVSLTNFNYYADNGNLRLRISLTSKDVKWYDGGKTKDFNYGSPQLFTIYHIPDENNYPDRWSIIRHGTFQRIDFHSDDALVWIDEHMTNGSFVTSKNYYVTVGGLF